VNRFRITVRGEQVELRGYVDAEDIEEVSALGRAMKPFGLVIASYADDDYYPFDAMDERDRLELGIGVEEA
jgi:hypothetical protein